MMQIALGFPQYNRRGGIERVFAELGSQFARRGHKVYFYAHEWTDMPALAPLFQQVPMIARPALIRPFTYALAMRRMRRKTNRHDILQLSSGCGMIQDIVCAQSCHYAWVTQSRSVLTPVQLRWWLKVLNPRHYLVCLLERIQYKATNHRRVIALSEQVKQDIIKFYGVREQNIVVIPMGVNIEEFSPALVARHRDNKRVELGIGPEDKLLLFVANEFPRKGLDTILQAMARLRDSSVKLAVVGRGDPKPYKRQIRELGLEQQVQFWPSTSEISAYYAASDVFVFPTRYEPFGLVIIEALACGIPVITSSCAGAAAAINPANGRLLDDPLDDLALAQHIQSVLEQPRSVYSEPTRRAVEQYAWSTIADQYLAVYADVLGEKAIKS